MMTGKQANAIVLAAIDAMEQIACCDGVWIIVSGSLYYFVIQTNRTDYHIIERQVYDLLVAHGERDTPAGILTAHGVTKYPAYRLM